MTTFRLIWASAIVMLTACDFDDANHVTSIRYSVSQFPGSSGGPWSCPLEGGYTDNSASAGAIDWTVGTPLLVNVVLRLEDGCGGWFAGPCPDFGDFGVVFSALNEATWTVPEGLSSSASALPSTIGLDVVVEAVSAGSGGLKVRADGRDFQPLELHAIQPAAFHFLRFDSDVPGQATLTPITRLSLAADASALVVPQLADASGKMLCGFAQQAVTATGVTVSPDDYLNMDGRTNAPVRVTAATASGNVHFVAANATGDLPVDVTP